MSCLSIKKQLEFPRITKNVSCMKKLNFYLALFIWLCASQISQAQNVPQGMRYQALAHDLNGNPLRTQTISLMVEILAGGPEGKVVYVETHQLATDPGGAFSLVIGEGRVQEGRFAAIPWSTAEIWLRTAIDERGGNDFKFLGSSRLLAVPYAFHAGSAEMLQPSENSEKPGCNAPGIPFWNLQGNSLVNDTCHFIGTTVAVDLIFKTSNTERMRVTKDGQFLVKGETRVADNLVVTSDLVTVNHQLDVKDDANMEQDLRVGGDLTIDGRLVIADNLVVTADTVLVKRQFVVKEDAFVKGDLKVQGDELSVNGMIEAKCVSLLGGCDWYELSRAKEQIMPGEVAVIDLAGGINAVRRCAKAYDRTVVGVVSGAGGVNPGLGLQQSGVLEGNTKIAMGGKVMVRVVGKVQPGDLLTSSSTQGCAMAVKNRRKAFGAVLGKALTSPNAEGLVLMQIMMQ